MAPPQQSRLKAQPAVTCRTKPVREEVKVSVLNIYGPFSVDITRPAKAQMHVPAKSTVPVYRAQPSVLYQADGKPVRSGKLSKETQKPTIMVGTCRTKDSVSRRTGSFKQHATGHSHGLTPLCLAGVSDSALKECLIIRSVAIGGHGPAAQ